MSLFAPDAAPARVPQRAAASWRCLYCRRGYVAAVDYHPDAATCPACGADLHPEGTKP